MLEDGVQERVAVSTSQEASEKLDEVALLLRTVCNKPKDAEDTRGDDAFSNVRSVS